MTDTDIRRDRWGRPLITPPGGGKPIAYTRASTLGGTLEDRRAIENWTRRNVVLGMAARPDLVALAAAKRTSKEAINQIADEAQEFALASSAANIGTALHGFVEQLNRGEEPWAVPAELQADLNAYQQVTSKWDVIDVEMFVVCDELQVAGSFDFTARSPVLGREQPRVFDLKTGAGAVQYGQGEIAVQLACYAHGERYNPVTGERTPLGVALNEAFVVHLPAGTGKATIHRVDIIAGWNAAHEAVAVREWRKTKNLFTPFTEAAAVAPTPELAALNDLTTVDELRRAYTELVVAGYTPAVVNKACRARLAEIT